MAREKDAVCHQCRREGLKLFLKGEKCDTEKCPIEKGKNPPGEHGRKPFKESEYFRQLREKQKAKRFYGVLEKQFKNYYRLAKAKRGISGENLLKLLEMRLDNVVYRLGFSFSRSEARQLIGHGHFTVNGRVVNIPSSLLKPKDIISLKKKKEPARVLETFKASKSERPSWLELDSKKLEGKVLREPLREEIGAPVKEQLIVEYYSK